MLSTLFCFATARHQRRHIETYDIQQNSYNPNEPQSVLYKIGSTGYRATLCDGYDTATNKINYTVDGYANVLLLENGKLYGDYYKAVVKDVNYGYMHKSWVTLQDYEDSYVSLAGKLGRKMINTIYSRDGHIGHDDAGMINYLYNSVGYKLNVTIDSLYKSDSNGVDYCRLGDIVLWGNSNFPRASIVIGRSATSGSSVMLMGTEDDGFIEVETKARGDYRRCVAVTNLGFYY